MLNEVEYGDAVIYGSLDDFFKTLDEMTVEDSDDLDNEEGN